MCAAKSKKSNKLLPILWSIESYKTKPSLNTTLVTLAFFVGMLSVSEHTWRFFFSSIQSFHPILNVELHRQILARHIGVDTLSCLVVSFLGLQNRAICQDLTSYIWGRNKEGVKRENFKERILTYHPASQRLATVFLAYQIHDLYDSLIWDDGLIYIFHHVMSALAAWGSMFPGFGHYYVIFFLGISEVSTSVLCVLANFDGEGHGVPGLDNAFPVMKNVTAITFVFLFIICRVILWPAFTKLFLSDARVCRKEGMDDKDIKHRLGWIRAAVFCLIGLSLLQVIFLLQIILLVTLEIRSRMRK